MSRFSDSCWITVTVSRPLTEQRTIVHVINEAPASPTLLTRLWKEAESSLCGSSAELYRGFQFLLQGAVLHEERPRHAADHGRRAAHAGRRGVGFAELQGAGGQVHLGAGAGHRVDVEVALLALQVQPEGPTQTDTTEVTDTIMQGLCFALWKNGIY